MSINEYLKSLNCEAEDIGWNDSIELSEERKEELEMEEGDSIEDFLSSEELQKLRYEFVISMETRAYCGVDGDCPIRNYDKSYSFKDIEVSEEAITLIY